MEVVPNIFLVKLPLPGAVDHVNGYLLRGENGWSMIDTGLHYQPSINKWEETFSDLGVQYNDIEGIYLTHMHPSHYGASGWFQERTGAPVFMSRAEIGNVDQTWKKGRINLPVIGELFKENGISHALANDLMDNMTQLMNGLQPHPTLSSLMEGEKVEMGGKHYEVIQTPGHTEGHIAFYQPEDQILISGDHLVPTGASKISLWPTSHPNPLELYFKSLETISGLAIKIVLPSHGDVFSDCSGRIQELINFYQERLDKIAELAGNGANAYQICMKLYGNELKTTELRVAITEVLALLAYLESKSILTSRLENGIVVYKRL